MANEIETTTARGSLVEQLAERLGARASSTTIFGEPIEREGVTVVPIAKARYVFGGGSGEGADGAGGGGGGGLQVEPVGYLQLENGQASFHRIKDPGSAAGAMLRGFLGVGLGIWLVLRGLAKFRLARPIEPAVT